MNLCVPQGISVVGFDDLLAATTIQQLLTTIRQPLRTIGKRATDILLAQIEGISPGKHQEVLPTELVLRASVVRRLAGRGSID